MSIPEALIIAGPNGSGKSTLTDVPSAFGLTVGEAYINPDVIARRLREQEPATLPHDLNRKAFQEGRRLRQTYREQRVSFALETVFSHPSGLLDLRQLREAGYRITLAVVTTCDPEINVRRIAERVKAGGHAVEEAKVRERYGRFMALLPRMVEMADRALVFDASDECRLCYQRERFPIEIDVPDYLRHALLEPLAARDQSRIALAGRLAPGETLELPDEAFGSYEGPLRACTPHYALQEGTAGHCVQHDRLLLSCAPPQASRVCITYQEGCGKVEVSEPDTAARQ